MIIIRRISNWLKRPKVSVAPESRPINLAAVEGRMKELDGQIDIPVEHIFGGGVYLRKIRIPAGTLVMGKRHRNETCNFLVSGILEVYTDENKLPVIIQGPKIFTTPPLAKKFAYCIEEAVFINILPTSEKDPAEIERQFIIPEHEYLESKEAPKCLS